MPTTSDYLFQFHATEAYRKYLDKVRAGLGLNVREGDYLRLVEVLCNRAGAVLDLKAPPRTKGVGGRRAGAGRKKAID